MPIYNILIYYYKNIYHMVLLFIPNIICYVRAALLFVVVYYNLTQPLITVVAYGLSQTLDFFDGMAARYFKQCTKFGCVLDMICDRTADAIILAILGGLYPKYCWFFYTDIILDIASHWYQMYSTLISGQNHHKQSKTNWKLLEIYYGNQSFLNLMIAGNQLFFLTAYMRAFQTQLGFTPQMSRINETIMWISFIVFLIKKACSVVQLISASETIIAIDMKQRQINKY